ncbi:hypothetical protein VE03_00070 [Pseudogymnoascus sp. 23342-1-I1]|nr:hypothetical protein VE03_00070 [Pseudogymnoascus sp. 23342-1-I1]
MDGLSGVASGIAVVSLAIQLAESVKKLCDFWESVKDAPAHFGAIQTDLRLLSMVLEKIDRERDLSDPCLRDVLKNCEGQVASLHKIVGDIVPGFKAGSRRTRTWASFKAAFKIEKVDEFKSCLQGMMLTLQLALTMASFRKLHTPTSLSINSSASFEKWADFIKESVENFEQFLEDEISAGVVAEEGWDIDSLRILFSMDVNPYEYSTCQLCANYLFENLSLEILGSFRYPSWEKRLAGIKWAANPERLEETIRNLGWRAKYDLLCDGCWGLSPEEAEEALERGGRIEELESDDSSTESDAESEELSDYDSPFLLSFG